LRKELWLVVHILPAARQQRYTGERTQHRDLLQLLHATPYTLFPKPCLPH
jgi:hypothetical protein